MERREKERKVQCSFFEASLMKKVVNLGFGDLWIFRVFWLVKRREKKRVKTWFVLLSAY